MSIRSLGRFALFSLFSFIGSAFAGESAFSLPAGAAAEVSSPPRSTLKAIPAVDPEVLERAQKKFKHALEIVDKFKAVAQAEGITGDNWRFNMLGYLMKGSEADFAAVSYARSYTEAVSTAYQVAHSSSDLRHSETRSASAAASTAVAADLAWPTIDLVYVPLPPCRVVDTRAGGSAISANTEKTYFFYDSNVGAESCSIVNQIPAGSVVAAFAANVTVVETDLSGFSPGAYLKMYPQSYDTTSSFLNFGPGQIIANAGIVSVNQSNGEFSVISNAPTHVIVDAYGVFIAPLPTALSCTTVTASRVVPANTNAYYNTTATCPAGKTAVAPYCWNQSLNGVYSGGGGVNASGVALCQWINTNASAVTINDGVVCCGVPGRY